MFFDSFCFHKIPFYSQICILKFLELFVFCLLTPLKSISICSRQSVTLCCEQELVFTCLCCRFSSVCSYVCLLHTCHYTTKPRCRGKYVLALIWEILYLQFGPHRVLIPLYFWSLIWKMGTFSHSVLMLVSFVSLKCVFFLNLSLNSGQSCLALATLTPPSQPPDSNLRSFSDKPRHLVVLAWDVGCTTGCCKLCAWSGPGTPHLIGNSLNSAHLSRQYGLGSIFFPIPPAS